MALKLKADPTFRAKVKVPVPGKDDVEVEFVFKHRSRTELVEFLKALDKRPHADYVEDILAGWQFADKFNRANIERLLDDHIGVEGRLIDAYVKTLSGIRLGN